LEFFRAARSKSWTDPSKPTKLIDDEPHVFSAYLTCLYFGADFLERRKKQGVVVAAERSASPDDLGMGCELTPSQFAEGPGDASDQDASQDELIGSANCESEDEDDSVRTESYDEHIESVRFLVDVYLIADKLLDPISANLVIDYLIDFVGSRKWTTDQATISHVYASTATGNPLRKLVLDWWLREVDQTWTRDYHRTEWGLPLEFLQDFII